jgi:tRNA (uracil-5-)-methyltransferase TRM9
MKPLTVLKLNEINEKFYGETAEYFSASRQMSWAGWEKLVKTIKDEKLRIKDVLDLGCGNGRFLKFISKEMPIESYLGIDQDEKLLEIARKTIRLPQLRSSSFKLRASSFDFCQCNLLSRNAPFFKQKYDLITLFGVLHHIPGQENRLKLLKTAFNSLSPSGVLTVSFWDFISEEKYRNRTTSWDKAGILSSDVEKNDFLLDWKRGVNALRYCHYADEKEIQDYIELLTPAKVTRFEADGKSGKLNKYLVVVKA